MDRDAAESLISEIYAAVLCRAPRANELGYWTDRAQAGESATSLLADFRNSKEYKKLRSVPLVVPPGHFYSPIVDPDSVRSYVKRFAGAKPESIHGISFPIEDMRQFWIANSDQFALSWGAQDRYTRTPGDYPESDARTLRTMITAFGPARIIEIGSGGSTACMLDAFDTARLHPKLICIEPNPREWLLNGFGSQTDRERFELIQSNVQDVPLSVFETLDRNDILFIDSTHVLKTGSDVHYELFSILPILKPGVLVHFHDCRYPFEYPNPFIFEKNRSWNEVYAVRALLMYSSRFQIIFYNSLFAKMHANLIKEKCPRFLINPGSSLWLKTAG